MANGKSYGLFSMSVGSQLQVFDLRPRAQSFVQTLEGLPRAVYEACDDIVNRAQLSKRLERSGIPTPSDALLESTLAILLEKRLVIHEDDKYLAVGIPLGYEFAPQGEARKRFIAAIRELQPRVDGAKSPCRSVPAPTPRL